MSTAPPLLQFRGTGARLGTPAGSLPAGIDLAISIDASALTLTGGDPLAAWQIPLSTLLGARARQIGEYVEITGWVSGSHVLLTIPASSLEGGSPEELVAFFEPPATAHGSDDASDEIRHRMTMMVVGAIIVVAVVIAVVIALVIQSSPGSTSSGATASDQSAAAAMNLHQSDVPSSWGGDSPTTSPLSGLLGTATPSKQTAQEKKVYNQIVSEFQHCMGETQQSDRMFGAAGVQPLTQVSSAPYGTVIGNNLIEVGSVTQIYATTADVHADLAQMKSAPFPKCFAQTMGRFTIASADPNQVTATAPVVAEKPRMILGAYVAGAAVTLQYPTTSGTTPMEIGTSIVISGRYEQTLYTFASPGMFPPAQRELLETLLAARLSGLHGTTSA
jgi:hypothetical protein